MTERKPSIRTERLRLPKWLYWLLNPIAIASFGFLFWHLWQNNAASAGASAAVGFAALVFRFFPDLESFQVLGMEMRLRQRIAEADELMEHLRKVAAAQSRVAVLSVAYSNRLGGMTWDEKSSTYDQLIAQLRDTGVDEISIEAIAEPFLQMASRDLLSSFVTSVSEVFKAYRAATEVKIQRLNLPSTLVDGPGTDELRILHEELNQYSSEFSDGVFRSGGDYRDIRAVASKLIEDRKLSSKDRDGLRSALEEISVLSERVWQSKKLDTTTVAFLTRYLADRSSLFSTHFPDGANGPDGIE